MNNMTIIYSISVSKYKKDIAEKPMSNRTAQYLHAMWCENYSYFGCYRYHGTDILYKKNLGRKYIHK